VDLFHYRLGGFVGFRVGDGHGSFSFLSVIFVVHSAKQSSISDCRRRPPRQPSRLPFDDR
jgi:hypothetical protein